MKCLAGSEKPSGFPRPKHTEQPMPNKDEAWATENRRFLRGCRKQSGADGVAAELAKARTEDGSGPTS